jgi:hypothetical protein
MFDLTAFAVDGSLQYLETTHTRSPVVEYGESDKK